MYVCTTFLARQKPNTFDKKREFSLHSSVCPSVHNYETLFGVSTHYIFLWANSLVCGTPNNKKSDDETD